MGLIATISGRVEVRAVPSFSLALNPVLVVLDYGSVSMVAKFAVTIQREAGHDKAVYLDLLGLVGNWTFSSDVFAPGVDTPVTLDIDCSGFAKDTGADFDVVGYDDVADRPIQEPEE